MAKPTTCPDELSKEERQMLRKWVRRWHPSWDIPAFLRDEWEQHRAHFQIERPVKRRDWYRSFQSWLRMGRSQDLAKGLDRSRHYRLKGVVETPREKGPRQGEMDL